MSDNLWGRGFFTHNVGLLVIVLSSLKLHIENNACILCAPVSCWVHLFLQHLRCRYLCIIRETDDQWIRRLTWNFSDCPVALRLVFLTQQQRLNCVKVLISTCTASDNARTPVNCSELHQQPVDAVLRPVFVQKLLYSVKHSCLLKGVKVVHLLYIASKFALFSVSDLKDEKLIKRCKPTWTRSQAVARIADRTAKNCRGHVT